MRDLSVEGAELVPGAAASQQVMVAGSVSEKGR
jgi:hypothetical protein